MNTGIFIFLWPFMNTGNFIIVSENWDATHKWGGATRWYSISYKRFLFLHMIAAIFIAVCFCFVVNYFFIT